MACIYIHLKRNPKFYYKVGRTRCCQGNRSPTHAKNSHIQLKKRNMDIYDSDSFATSWQACSPQQEQCLKKPRKRRKKDGKSGAKNTDRYDKNSAKDSDRSVKNNDQGTLEYSDASTTATSDSQYFTGQWTRKEREILNTLVENEERQKNEARQTFKNLLCYRNSEEGDRSEDANSWFKRYVSKLFQPPSSPDKRATDQQDIMYSVASFEV